MEYERKDKFIKPHTPADLLKLALLKEKSSFEFYEQLIKENKDPLLEKILLELKNAEWGHIQKIKKELER